MRVSRIIKFTAILHGFRTIMVSWDKLIWKCCNQFMVLTNKNGRITVTQTVLVTNSHVSAHISHHQMILEEYTNGDGINMNNNAGIYFLLVKIGSAPT
jgi:hypothetical protein